MKVILIVISNHDKQKDLCCLSPKATVIDPLWWPDLGWVSSLLRLIIRHSLHWSRPLVLLPLIHLHTAVGWVISISHLAIKPGAAVPTLADLPHPEAALLSVIIVQHGRACITCVGDAFREMPVSHTIQLKWRGQGKSQGAGAAVFTHHWGLLEEKYHKIMDAKEWPQSLGLDSLLGNLWWSLCAGPEVGVFPPPSHLHKRVWSSVLRSLPLQTPPMGPAPCVPISPQTHFWWHAFH
jgi:hypothetical protein